MPSQPRLFALGPLLDALDQHGLTCHTVSNLEGTYVAITLYDGAQIAISGTTKDGTEGQARHLCDDHNSWQAYLLDTAGNRALIVYNSHGHNLSYDHDTAAVASAAARYIHTHNHEAQIRQRLSAITARLNAAGLPALHTSQNVEPSTHYDPRDSTQVLSLATAAADLYAHAPADLAFLLSLVRNRNSS